MKIVMRISLLIVSLIFVGNLFAQDASTDSIKYWKFGGNTSLAFSQVSLTNWSAGGENSMSGTFVLNSFLNYKKESVSWENSFNLGYGLSKREGQSAVKTDDRIQLASKYGLKASKKWLYTALLDFKTQMTNGYQKPPSDDEIISRFMAPAYLFFSVGMDYKPNDNFSMYISPLTSKTTIVADDTLSHYGAFGVTPDKTLREEYGAFLKSTYTKENIIKNVDFATKVDLFSNLAEHPERVDVNWETTINMKVNEYLTAVIATTLVFDDDIKYIDKKGEAHGARVQFKQLLGFGLNYKF